MEPAVAQDTLAESDIGLRDYLHILYRRRWWFLGSYAAVVAFIGIVTITATPLYQGKTKLLVEASRFGSSGRSGDVLAGLTGMEQMRTVETQIEIIKSAAVVDKAMEALKIGPDDPRPTLSVETMRQTDMIVISSRSPDPKLAADAANEFARQYVDLTLQRNRQTARQGREFVEKQAREAEAELDHAENELAQFREQSGITSVSEATTSLITQAQKQADDATAADAAVAADRAEIAALRSKLARSKPFVLDTQTVSRNPIIDGLRSKLATLEADRASLAVEFAPTSEKLRAIDRQIAQITAQMAREAGRVVTSEQQTNPLDSEIVKKLALAEVQLMADIERSGAIRRGLQVVETRVERLPNDQRVTAELTRDVKVLEDRYLTLVSKLQELQLAEMVEIPSATVLEPAKVPESRVYPNRKKNLVLAIVLGFGVALGVALLVNHLDNTFASVQEIEDRLGISVLAVVYRQGTKDRTILNSPLGKSPFAESFRMIRSGLRFSSVTKPIGALVMTSVAMGEGKSTVAANTAIACAEGGQKVVLVDADLRRPSQHRIFGVENTRGLTNCLVDNLPLEETLRATEFPNLSFMSSGPIPPNPGELLDAPAMRALVQELRSRFDLVVLDTPPGTILADARILGQLADATILVLDMDSTKRPAMEYLVDVLRREGSFLPGVVVNKARHAPGSYYYYGSYYYAEYYGEHDE